VALTEGVNSNSPEKSWSRILLFSIIKK
jgi:hypothetical protein